jgi:mRNA-degrading endonuclease RelE of RelBE toxin-antitoxin system
MRNMGGVPILRIKGGDYRIIYQIHKNMLLVLVVRIGPRKEVDRHLSGSFRERFGRSRGGHERNL